MPILTQRGSFAAILVLLCCLCTLRVCGEEIPFNRPATFPTTEGTYIVGDWKYRFSIISPKTKSQGAWGRLYYKDWEMAAPRNTVVNTPVGEFVFLGGLYIKGWGEHGWFNTYVDYNGTSNAIFQPDGTLRVVSPVTAKRISTSELLDLNQDGTYQAEQSMDWREAKIGAYVEINERKRGFLKYRGHIIGCDVVALSMDTGSAYHVEDLKLYVQKNSEMLEVLSLPMVSRKFSLKEVDGKLNIFMTSKTGFFEKTPDSPSISVDLGQLVQAYGNAVSPSKKD